MGNYWSYEVETSDEGKMEFTDPHTGYKPWVTFQYNKRAIERFNNPRTLIGR